MNDSVKKIWVDALLSGEFKQCSGGLHDTKGNYCCLGVLCELYMRQEGVDATWRESDNDMMMMLDHKLFLPDEVAEWADVDKSPGVYINDMGDWAELSHLNDEGYSFSDIAKLISNGVIRNERA